MSEKKNPFSLVFGKEPPLSISRVSQINRIIDTFTAENPVYQVCMLTGIRGSGKTVMLTEISKALDAKKDWIVVNLNPERDMLQALAATLYSDAELYTIFHNAKINLSLFGIGVEIEGAPPISDIEVAIAKLLEHLKKMGKKVLVTVDEVTGNDNVRIFSASFQIFLRQELPVFLLMTGLYENVNALQNERSLTFLIRSPKVRMEPLNLGAMANRYQQELEIDHELAVEMARLTRGYAFAFQVLGYLSWGHGHDIDSVIPEYRQYLEDFVYQKIWSELSAKDKEIVRAVAECDSGEIAQIRDVLQITTNQFNPYRKRLIDKEILDGSVYGRLSFTLPMFDLFVRESF